MALINCPECGKQISDQAGACPNCGCPIGESDLKATKKVNPKRKKAIILISCSVAVLLVAIAVVYILLIKPTLLYNEAVKEYERGNTQEAIEILDELPNNKKACALVNEIVYKEALTAFNDNQFEEAKRLLKRIPDYTETALLLQEINNEERYQEAIGLLEQGNYNDAATILQEILDYKNVSEVQEQMKYESYAYSCVKEFKKMLKNPDSFVPYEIEFYVSANEEDIYPICIMHYGAQNGFGGNTTGYIWCSKDNDELEYEVVGSCDSLDEDSYDESDIEEIYEKIICIAVNETRDKQEKIGEIDFNRFKTVLKNEAYSTIKIIE